MSYEQAYKEWLPKLDALTNDAIKKPRIPIKVICAEAEALFVACRDDKDLLVNAGLNWQDVEDIISLSSALRYCEANWKSSPSKSAE